MNFYRDEIMEIYERPCYQGICQNPTFRVARKNNNCGDKIHIEGVVSQGQLQSIVYGGSLCVISTVGAELVIDFLKNHTINQLLHYSDERILKEIGLEDVRQHCALLAFHTLQEYFRNL